MAAQWDPISLRQAMSDRMSSDEVATLCFNLGVDWDDLAGDTKGAKIRELIQYMQRRSRFDELTAQLARVRPDILPPGADSAPKVAPASTPTPQPVNPQPSNSTPVSPQTAGPTRTYVDFDVTVASASGGYSVSVRSPAGEANAITQIMVSADPIASGVAALKRAQFDSALAKSLGSALLAALLQDGVSSAYYATLGATSQSSGIRLRLHINAPELKALPWEYLYDAKRDNFLAVRRDVVISRYLEVFQGVPPLSSSSPLRILALLSGPTGPAALDLVGEQRRITDALATPIKDGRVVVEFETNPTTFNIRDRLWNNTYHIVHFSGHAYYATESKLVLNQSVTKDTGYVVLPNDDGTARLLDEASFAQSFVGNPSIRLVILNACQGAQTSLTEYLSGLGDKLVQTAGIPAVIAMQFPFADMAAKQFAREFYTALAQREPIDAAVARARLALFQDLGADNRAWGTPVLFMRSADGRLFA